MKKIVTVLFFAVASLAAPVGLAQNKDGDVTDMQALRAAIKSDKKWFVAATLQLKPAEAKKFWPIYDTYQLTIDATNLQHGLAEWRVLETDTMTENVSA